jgi:hypothetical protein
MKHTINEYKKFILAERIYPAIKECVNNRYKILIGFFAYYAFVTNTTNSTINTNIRLIQIVMAIVFSVFIIFNSISYYLNTREQLMLETGNRNKAYIKNSLLEFIFGLIMLFINWISYFLVKI